MVPIVMMEVHTAQRTVIERQVIHHGLQRDTVHSNDHVTFQ